MNENKLFEVLLDVVPFAAYAVDIETYEVVYANKMMSEQMYAPREEFCWKKVFGQEEACSWCSIPQLQQREKKYKNEKLVNSFFDEGTDTWLQTYDELVSWPDGRTVKYSIAVDITEQKEIQASMIKTHTKLAMQSKKLKEANEKLHTMATKDFLTGVNNRGYFFKLGEKMFLNTSIENPIFVAMFDLDKFKLLNDAFGHKLGDIVLQSFTQEVQKILEKSDIFGRLGGEEFALISQTANKDIMIDKLETIRQNIADIVLTKDDRDIIFTVSIGMVQKKENETLDTTLDRADKELYNAKEEGRNRVKFRI